MDIGGLAVEAARVAGEVRGRVSEVERRFDDHEGRVHGELQVWAGRMSESMNEMLSVVKKVESVMQKVEELETWAERVKLMEREWAMMKNEGGVSGGGGSGEHGGVKYRKVKEPGKFIPGKGGAAEEAVFKEWAFVFGGYFDGIVKGGEEMLEWAAKE